MSYNHPGRGNAKDERNPAITAAWIGAVAVVVAALIAGLFTLILRSSTPSTSSGQGNAGRPAVSISTPDSPPSLNSGKTWLDQLTPTSGVVNPSDAAPDSTTQVPLSPLPHELLIAPAVNSNDVTFALAGKYKTLHLEVATTGGSATSAGTFLNIFLDDGNSVAAETFSPGETPPQEWVIDVPGVKDLKLNFNNVNINGTQGTALLVSGWLS